MRGDKPDPEIHVTFPQTDGTALSQDEEYCIVEAGGERHTIRFHDYQQIYKIPGLYEKIFYDRLECQSPALIGTLLEYETTRRGMDMEDLMVLDVGAGNGIMGELLNEAGVETVVGVDILKEAAEAAQRDRPGVYDAYYPVDLLNPPQAVEMALDAMPFNCLTLVAALGFGDIPAPVFATAYNHVADGGLVAFNLKESFTTGSDPSGFAALIQQMEETETFEKSLEVQYVHRLNMRGEPLLYHAFVGCKLHDISGEDMPTMA